MFNRVFRLASTVAEYTVGTATVLTHLALADRIQQRERELLSHTRTRPDATLAQPPRTLQVRH